MKKQPSPDVNPDNQYGSMILGFFNNGPSNSFFGYGTISGNAAFNSSDKPRFIDALSAKISFNPSVVRCSRSGRPIV